MIYGLDLFQALNEEYRSKPLVAKSRTFDAQAQKAEGSARVKMLTRVFGGVTPMRLAGKRVLEIGCGRGNTCREVADELDCEVVGVDITNYTQWKQNEGRGVTLHKLDISTQDYAHLGQFDFIYSIAVWEHMYHPYAALKATRQLLKPWKEGKGGAFYMSANLYRGPKASHRYREVYFPWPHLLFQDEIFRKFYESIGKLPASAAWVNKLVSAEYLQYYQELGFQPKKIWYSTTQIDEGFYKRFEEILGRYPRFDLERDFIHAVLTVDSEAPAA